MLKHIAAIVGLTASLAAAQVQLVQSNREGTVKLTRDGQPVWAYVTRPQPGVKLPSPSVGYFHPIYTPSGEVLTDVAPADHVHHRGVFLAWVEMHGSKDADFWGWGKPAPINDRVIAHTSVGNQSVGGGSVGVVFRNAWNAEGHTMLQEELATSTRFIDGVNVIDLTYTLTPTEDITLSRWAFSGFCYRARGDGEFSVHDAGGEVTLPNPRHTEPASDWPDRPWYSGVTKLASGKSVGMAVVNHPANPPTLWHNHRKPRMINPCITAPGQVKLTKGKPLVLRYRLVAHDGLPPVQVIQRLASEFQAVGR